MYALLIHSLKAGVCLAVFYLFFKALLSRETFHRFNRALLLGAVALSFALPVCVVTIEREAPLPPQPALPVVADDGAALSEPPGPVSAPLPWREACGALFAAGAAAMLLRSLWSLASVRRLIRRGVHERLDDGAVLVRLAEAVTPFSFGRYVVVSERDLAESGPEIVTHERAHLRLRHTWDLLAMDVAGMLQWFNPAMWLLRRELRAIHEYEADEAVLASGVDARRYQLLLIKKAAGGRWCSVANSFNHSKLKNRITMMLREKSSRWAGARALLLLPLVGLAVGAFAETAYVVPDDKVTKETRTIRISGSDFSDEGLQYVVDGEVCASAETLRAIDSGRIASVRIAKEPGESALVSAVSGLQGSVRRIRIEHADTRALSSAVIVVDGEVRDAAALEALDPDRIESITVVKSGAAAERYGDAAAEGAIEVTTRQGAAARRSTTTVRMHRQDDGSCASAGAGDAAASVTTVTSRVSVTVTGDDEAPASVEVCDTGTLPGAKAVYVIDGRMASAEELAHIAPERIERVTVTKDASAAERYGTAAANGVVEVTTKHAMRGLTTGVGTCTVTAKTTPAGNSVSVYKGRFTIDPASIAAECRIFIDGRPATRADVGALAPKSVRRAELFGEAAGREKYGEAGCGGVLEIATRR